MADYEEMDDIIEFQDEDGEDVRLKIIAQTTINGDDYFLMTENVDFDVESELEDDEENMKFIYKDGEVQRVDEPKEVEVECIIMKKTGEDEEDITLESVDDEDELEAVSQIFAQLMSDDVDFES
ncbi:MAG: DUF1292 domain-containing protein [Lachnospiraceae bacterium]|nr:DUF1292 domain-containing protein [Lachnospiraceae bacterium]